MKPNKDEYKGITDMANAIDKIPNSISGDGSSFVAQLKNALGDLETNANSTTTSEKTYCNSVEGVTLTQIVDSATTGIRVEWLPTSVAGYSEAKVYYRPIRTTKFSLAGSTSGNTLDINGVEVGTRYAVKVVPIDNKGRSDNNPKEYYIDIVDTFTIPSTVRQFLVTFESGIGHFQWIYDSQYYDYFELRTDDNVGVFSDSLLARTTEMSADVTPNVTRGSAYLYVRNQFGIYGAPAVIDFNMSIEGRPKKPSVEKTANGIKIFMQAKPSSASEYVLQIEEDEYETIKNPFFLYRVSGTLKCRYCWSINENNRGEWSDWLETDLDNLVDADGLSANAIELDNVSQELKDAIALAEQLPSVRDSLNNRINATENSLTELRASVNDIVGGELSNMSEYIDQKFNAVSDDVTSLRTTVNGNTTAIAQNSSEINSLALGVSGNSTLINQQADRITSLAASVSGNTSAITQNSTTIATLVSDLSGAKTSIQQNANNISLVVADGKLSGNKIVSAINVGTGGVTIDGKAIHVTGDTVFDNDVKINGSLILNGTIVNDKIANGAVTSGKLSTNAVTSDKISANAVTTDKINSYAITSDKIKASAITADKIVAGAIRSTHIDANAVTADKIAAGSVNTSKLAAADISLAGKLQIVGGAVTLNENGLRCLDSSGDSVVFNNNGMNFVDNNGNTFAAVKRIVMGEAYNGKTVTFTKPFKSSPLIICNPKNMQVGVAAYSSSNVYLVCQATNITPNSFKMNCYTQLGAGSSNNSAINLIYTLNSKTATGYNRSDKYTSSVYWYDKTYDYRMSVPVSATTMTVNFDLTVKGYLYEYIVPGDNGWEWDVNPSRAKVQILVDNVVKYDTGFIREGSVQANGQTTKSYGVSLEFSSNSSVVVRLTHGVRQQNVGDDGHYATLNLKNAVYNTSVATVISQGTASFIAVDNGEYYSVT